MAKRYDEAQECLEKADSLMPEKAEILSAIGNLMGDLGKYSEAIDYCEKSLDINNQLPDTWYLLGNYYANQKKYELANDSYAEAVELNPRLSEAWTGKGKTSYYLGFYKESISAFVKKNNNRLVGDET